MIFFFLGGGKGVKTYSDPSFVFSGGQDPQSRDLRPGYNCDRATSVQLQYTIRSMDVARSQSRRCCNHCITVVVWATGGVAEQRDKAVCRALHYVLVMRWLHFLDVRRCSLATFVFSASILMIVGRQEGHPSYKTTQCWHCSFEPF